MRTFSDLADAVQRLAAALEADDRSALAELCRDELPPEWVVDRLREQNRETPLVELYAGRSFPQDARTFKLGGHGKELGHIHIDFVRMNNGWQVQKIWMCR